MWVIHQWRQTRLAHCRVALGSRAHRRAWLWPTVSFPPTPLNSVMRFHHPSPPLPFPLDYLTFNSSLPSHHLSPLIPICPSLSITFLLRLLPPPPLPFGPATNELVPPEGNQLCVGSGCSSFLHHLSRQRWLHDDKAACWLMVTIQVQERRGGREGRGEDRSSGCGENRLGRK